MSLFTRAAAYMSLTPLERAFLRLVEGLTVTAFVTALPIVAEALAQQSVDWNKVLRTAAAAASVAVLLAVIKLLKAYRDPTVLPASMQMVQQQSNHLDQDTAHTA